jgi:hypothetical protein
VELSAGRTVIYRQFELGLDDLFFFNNKFGLLARRVAVLAATGFGRVEILGLGFSDAAHVL